VTGIVAGIGATRDSLPIGTERPSIVHRENPVDALGKSWDGFVNELHSVKPVMIFNYITVTATQERWIFPLQIRRVLIKYIIAAYSG
jgi:hypothetical protein